jgi:hypothetical protein
LLIGFLLGLRFDPKDGNDIYPKCRSRSKLQGVTSQYKALYRVTAFRTSNPEIVRVIKINNSNKQLHLENMLVPQLVKKFIGFYII